MSHGYVPVQWNRNKIVYDLVLWSAICAFIALYVVLTMVRFGDDLALSPAIVLMRSLAVCAFVMLNVILCIGPLARLSNRFLPLLYNRRHLGVSMFIVALTHAIVALVWYHGFGVENPIASLFSSPGSFTSIDDFPFQPFGAVALLIFALMAATSHDYWNTNLGAPFWKALHMGVYVAYGLIIVHVATGAMQNPNTGIHASLVFGSVGIVGLLHLLAAIVSKRTDVSGATDEWVEVGSWRSIPDNGAITVRLPGSERVAVFRYEGSKLAAVANVCKHQNGPLGEGRVIDGCITCPWHGFQYRPEDGRSPAPFTEKIATYDLRLEGEQVMLRTNALPDGTARPITLVEAQS